MKLRSNDKFIVFKKSNENPDAIVFGKDIGKYNSIQPSRYFNFKKAIIVGGTSNEITNSHFSKISRINKDWSSQFLFIILNR